jgi:acetyl-CoA decarbonylase/synthase complex subunit gamma
LIAPGNIMETVSWFLVITAISSFLAMNFTGSSTYTSLSGVKKEMKISLPFQIGFVFIGLVLQIVGKLIY